MKRVHLSDLHEMPVLSDVLDQAIYLLSNSEVQFRASNLSRVLGIHASVLTRMKLLHVNPQYEPVVNRYVLLKVLRFLFDLFPTLIIWRNAHGDIIVRLYKKFCGAKLEAPQLDMSNSVLLKRTPPKPGTTRWYLEQP